MEGIKRQEEVVAVVGEEMGVKEVEVVVGNLKNSTVRKLDSQVANRKAYNWVSVLKMSRNRTYQ